MIKLLILIPSLLLILGCKSEVDKCVDAQMDYFAQYQKKIESQASAPPKPSPPPKKGPKIEDFGYKWDLPEPVPEAKREVMSPEKAKAMFRIDCLKAQAGS